jgi:hypothetical protein
MEESRVKVVNTNKLRRKSGVWETCICAQGKAHSRSLGFARDDKSNLSFKTLRFVSGVKTGRKFGVRSFFTRWGIPMLCPYHS